ncbi:hypothetical protein [Saltatorellus ferox]
MTKRSLGFRLALLATGASTLQLAHGQEILHVIDGPRGASYDQPWAAPDGDGDGIDDLLVVGFGSSFRGASGSLYSMATGAEIWFEPFGEWATNGLPCHSQRSSVIGDYDGDGDPDLAVGCSAFNTAFLPSEVFIVDMTTGAEVGRLLSQDIEFGDLPGPAGDTNGDGYADILVADSTGRQNLYLGPHGTLAMSFTGPSDRLISGWTVGDIDLDGGDDFLIGWGQSGIVDVHSGRTGALIGSLCAVPQFGCGGLYGAFAVPLGDTNADGVSDFAISAGNVNFPQGMGGVGGVRIISGADLTILHSIYGRPKSASTSLDKFGSTIGGGHDVNGDGVADLAVASVSTRGSYGSLVSGRTGQILYQVFSDGESGSLSLPPVEAVSSAQTIPDINGDGYAEWVVGSYGANYGGFVSGRSIVLSGGPGDAEVICESTQNSSGRRAGLDFYGAITPFTRGSELRIRRAVPGSVAAVLFGVESAPQMMGSGVLCIDPTTLHRYAEIVPLDATGLGIRAVDWGDPSIHSGPSQWVTGATWTIQAIFRDPGSPSGFQTTDALRVQFGG